MKSTANHDDRIARMSFAAVYPMYVAKVEKKGRTEAELHQVIEWLTGFDAKTLQGLIAEQVTFAEFFRRAKLNEHAKLITGTICGYRVEDIGNPLTQKARYLDKLVDELAQGRAMEKILRSPQTATSKAAPKVKAGPGSKAAPKAKAAPKPQAAPKPRARKKKASP